MRRTKIFSVELFVIIALVLTVPGFSSSGDLEPPGPPGSTMKTLDEIPPTWSIKLQCDTTASCPRFELVLDGQGALDKETGLVWEQNPSSNTKSWGDAQTYCFNRYIGGRKGWRTPSVEELSSLLPSLPNGHPFSNVQSDDYWSATAHPTISGYALRLDTIGNMTAGPQGDSYYIWCVRGGRGL